MKLTYKLAMALLLFSGMAEVYADKFANDFPSVGPTHNKYADDFPGAHTPINALVAKKASPPKTSPQGQAVPRPSAGDPIPTPGDLTGDGKAATSAISDQGQTGVSTSYGKGTSGGTVTPGPRPDANSALQQVSTTRKNVTGGPAFSATNEPIPGIDIIVKKPSAKSSISDQSAGGNLSRPGPANISDQGQTGVSTSYGKGTSGGTVTPGPRPSAGDPIPGVDVMLPNGGGKAAPRAISDQAQGGTDTTNPNRMNTGKGTVTPGPRPDNNEGLQQVSTTRKTATSMAIDPIPGVDIIVKKKHGAKSSISDQSAGGNLSRTGPANISDQGQTGVSTSYGKGTSGGTVTPGPRPDANSAMQDVSTTRKTSTSATIDWGDGTTATTGSKASKEAGKPAAPAIFDRWGNYAASNPASRTASPQKDAEHNSAQGIAAARKKYNVQSAAGSPGAPTPLMNGPNAGLVLPAAMSPAMQGPLMTPGGAMSPGGH